MTGPSTKPGSADFAPWADPDAEPFVRIEAVTKTFGDAVAVNRLDLEIYRGELFSLLGPSGCGKTTLLRMIAGFETPSEGRILIDGIDMTRVPPYERPVNMVFQTYALFPHMSVAQNIAFGLKQDGVPKGEIRDRVDEVLSLVRLLDFHKRKPDQMSGGQRQRVALARALVKRPKILLLDEPLAALDKKLREETQFELVNIQEKIGVTFIMVTHDQEEAMTMSTRMAVMDVGVIEQVGTPYEIYEFPATSVVANFVGVANTLWGTVDALTDEGVVIDCAGITAPVHVEQHGPLIAGAPVSVMLRPEKIAVTKTRPDTDHNLMSGTVKEIAYLGDMSIYHVEIETGERLEVSLTNARHNLEERPSWEDKVWLSFHPANAVVLSQ